MNNSSIETIVEARTVFDDRAIGESDVELTESGDFVLGIFQRVDTEMDEVHVFPLIDSPQARDRVHTAMKQLAEDSENRVSEVYFQPGADERLILAVQLMPGVDEYNAGREAASYLRPRI